MPADLDEVILHIAKKQNEKLKVAAQKRHDRYMAMAKRTEKKESKDRYKRIAKNTLLQAADAMKRLKETADKAAASYARSMKKLK